MYFLFSKENKVVWFKSRIKRIKYVDTLIIVALALLYFLNTLIFQRNIIFQ